MNEEHIVMGPVAEKNDTLQVTLHEAADTPKGLIVHLKGYSDTYNSGYFRRQLTRILKAGFTRIIFDFREVTYFASQPVGELVEFKKEVRRLEGDVAVLGPQPRVLEVFRLLGLEYFLNIQKTMEEALSFFAQQTGRATGPFPLDFSCPTCGKRLRARKAGHYACTKCKALLRIDEAGKIALDGKRIENDLVLIPEKTEKVIRLLTDLAQLVLHANLKNDDKKAFDKMLNQIVLNIFQREVKDVWAELEQVA